MDTLIEKMKERIEEGQLMVLTVSKMAEIVRCLEAEITEES